MQSQMVQFREDSRALGYLRKKGLNPNQFAREAFQSVLRRMQAQETAEELAKIKARLPKRAAEIVREERDSH